jgi:hypothetical protein
MSQISTWIFIQVWIYFYSIQVEIFKYIFYPSRYRGALKYLARSFKYAVHDLNEAIKLDQTCALAYFNRALCYQQLKEYNNSLKDFSVVLMLGDYLEYKVVFRAL